MALQNSSSIIHYIHTDNSIMGNMGPLDTVLSLPSPLQCSSHEPYSLDSGSTAKPLGTLGALPTEIMWMIFDRLLTKECGLEHRGLCGLRSLSLTSKTASTQVSSYLARQNESRYIQTQLHHSFSPKHSVLSSFFPPDRMVHDNDMEFVSSMQGRRYDVITQTIIDDCPECLVWMSGRIPSLLLRGYNQAGWKYVAIAMQARSVRFLEYIYRSNTLHTAGFSFLASSSHVSVRQPSSLTLMIQHQDLEFIERVLNLVESSISRSGDQSRAQQAEAATTVTVAREDMYSLCKFITPELASRFVQLGVRLDGLWDSRQSQATCYHAAVHNGLPFLRWLERNSSMDNSMMDYDGETPLHYAVRADRLDCVAWLRRHGGARTQWDNRRIAPARIAAERSTEMSEVILKDLVTTPASENKLDSQMTGLLLYAVSRGLWLTRSGGLDSRPVQRGYLRFLRDEEDRAIRKVLIIMEHSSGLTPRARNARGTDSRCNKGLQKYNQAKRFAAVSGSFRLLSVLCELVA